ncbi:MAG: hypothetical protein GY847_09505 [Proteobacteria bacterium]|nr:hypothetical protein [Pseudomonadota bacterium]
MKIRDLTRKHFEQCPVWTWDEAQEFQVPVMTEGSLPSDKGTLFIKARLRSSSDHEFSGYIGGLVSIYCIGIFIGSEEFCFNRNLPEMAKVELAGIFDALGVEPFPVFPLVYTTDFHFENRQNVEGIFNFD